MSDDGYFVFGLDRDRKYDVIITIENSGLKRKLKKVLKRKYNIQRIDGLDEKRLLLKRFTTELNRKITKLKTRAINSDLNYFKDKFMMPVKGIISGVYGSQRILNGKPKWPHYGIDIAAKKGQRLKRQAQALLMLKKIYIIRVELL